MRDQLPVVVTRWSGRCRPAPDEVGRLLAAYHLQTEAEKGVPVADVAGLPDRYRAEVADPRAVFAEDVVLVALSGETAVGCVVVATPPGGRTEIKRLWVEPAARGRGVAASLVGAALAHARASGTTPVRLSVWRWRTAAIALYERLGFRVASSWDPRPEMVCMESG